jgi:MFS family permease
MKNKAFLYYIIASTLRFFGGFSIGFWSAPFFQAKYPNEKTHFAIANAFVVVVGGLSSSYFGGWITDKYEDRYPKIKGQISGYGALASTIFIVITYTLQINFWVSMASLFCAYLTAEMWYGPAHAAVNRIFPSEYQGIAIAIFTLLGSFAGAAATYFLGLLNDKYDVKSNPELAGYLITGFVCFSYCSCCPMFLIAARAYQKEIEGQK